MFFLVRHDRQTFVIDLEPHRDRAAPLSYVLDQSFELEGNLKPLSSLEATMPQVCDTYAFEIAASACESGGLIIKATRFCEIRDPLPKAEQGDVGDEEDDQGDIGKDVDAEIDAYCEDDASSQCEVDVVVERVLFDLTFIESIPIC